MHLYLSGRSPLDSVFTDENGQAIFKVQTSFKFSGRETRISRIVPGGLLQSEGDKFGHLAEIKFKCISSSIIRFGGKAVKTADLFRKEGWGWYGRHRVFTGPDGREYKWMLGATVPKLVLNDEAKTPVANFHRKRIGIIRKARPASLEIFRTGEHMIDMILITFVYIEKLRKDKEDSAKSSGGG